MEASRGLRDRVVAALAEHWDVEAREVGLADGRAFTLDGQQNVSAAEAFQVAEARWGSLAGTGSYRTQTLGGDYRGGTIGASPAYSFTAHVAEVEVDVETGALHVVRVWAAHDCGRALAPVLVEGQIEGSVYMGAAEAQMEAHRVHGDTGLHLGPSLLDYKLPTALDVPDVVASIVESMDPEGPYGAKEAGEGPLHPAIPAISNAIFDAVGIRLRSTPFSPAKILSALTESSRRLQQRARGA